MWNSKTKKLLQLKVDVGFAIKNIFAGIRSNYKPEDLMGKLVAVVANLQPRKMKFGLSEGMVQSISDQKYGRLGNLRVLLIMSIIYPTIAFIRIIRL